MGTLGRFLVSCVLLGPAGPTGLVPVVGEQPAGASGRLDVHGTEFTLTLPDGRVLRSPELVGAVLSLTSSLRVRIEAVEEERDGRGGRLWLHTMSAQGADGSWSDLCLLGPDGRRAGFPVPGRATGDGTLAAAAPGVFELTCTAGAQAKCVRFGYRPWEAGPDGRPMRDLYNACVRMVRADYGGDGHATTRDGTLIDVYDAWGIQAPDLSPDHAFEAGWGATGAVCVRHTRVKEHVSLDELERRYPQLRGRTGAVCTEDFARGHGALLFNRSLP